VLPLCFGEATKFSQYLLDSDKGYETLAQLGKTTTTADAEGEVLQERGDRWSRRYRSGAAEFSWANQSDTADVLGAQA
jgi:tRNA U55 pseudouridine synthase TruB